MSEGKSYTFTCDEIAKLIIIPVIFEHNNHIMKTKALIDTGAAFSYISQFISDSLSIPQTGKIYRVQFGEDKADRPSVKTTLILSSDILFENEEFTVLKDEPRLYDAIIGMNILSRTDFSVSNYNGQTIFSFRLPSQGEIKYGDAIDHEVDLKNVMDKIEDALLST